MVVHLGTCTGVILLIQTPVTGGVISQCAPKIRVHKDTDNCTMQAVALYCTVVQEYTGCTVVDHQLRPAFQQIFKKKLSFYCPLLHIIHIIVDNTLYVFSNQTGNNSYVICHDIQF